MAPRSQPPGFNHNYDYNYNYNYNHNNTLPPINVAPDQHVDEEAQEEGEEGEQEEEPESSPRQSNIEDDPATYSRQGDPPPDPNDDYHPLREEKFIKHAERFIRQDAAQVDWEEMNAIAPWLAKYARFDQRMKPCRCVDPELGRRLEGLLGAWVGEDEDVEWSVLRILSTGSLSSLRWPARVYPLNVHQREEPEITLIRDDRPLGISRSYALTPGTCFEFLGTVALTPGCDCLYVMRSPVPLYE